MAIKFLERPYSAEEVESILHPLVRKWFFSRFNSFSLPQLYGVMEIHKRNNILISAPTGATKTLTAFLAILNELVDSAEKGILEDKIYCVYVSPLKALNRDIERNLKEPLAEIEKLAGKKLGIRIAVRTGDTSANERQRMLKNPPHILITTPETLGIVLTTKKFVDLLKDVQWCIVDEIHALAENKRGVHLSLSLERLQRLSPALCRIGLSATIAPLDEVAKFLVGFVDGKPRNCLVVDVPFKKKTDLKVLCPVKDMINVSGAEMQKRLYDLLDSLIQSHRTTLIFTNTRSATERVVDHLKERFPKSYEANIGAHHSSLSKQIRHNVENRLKEGKLKVVVSSTSLELGIDIGYIDLVICLGSPKSVARALQRIGRSGHRLHDVTKGRIVVLDRDDLVECAVLLKEAIERKIDRIHLPRNCLDVLSQHVVGMVQQEKWRIDELFALVKQSYSFHDLSWERFMDVIVFLSGGYGLEAKNVYAKIWYDAETGFIGRRGRTGRVIYMTNIGTIPDESYVLVKVGDQVVGKLDELFLERLRKGDIFCLGGELYEFVRTQGMVAFAKPTSGRPPTIPSWISEMLPLSFDLALAIGKFRRLLEEKFCLRKSRKEIMDFIMDYLYVDENAVEAIYNYFKEQFYYAGKIPHDKKIVIEHYSGDDGKYVIFHSLFGRRVNDCLARAIGYAIAKTQKRNVEIGVNDNGFFVRTQRPVNVMAAFKLLKSENFDKLLKVAIDKTEVLKRRFRHCAARALMILRQYKGKQKSVGRQQLGANILLSTIKRIDPKFCILEEARREVLEDLMDVNNAKLVLKWIEDGRIKVEEIFTSSPSPFAFNLVLQSYWDVLKLEDRLEFLRRMHQVVMAKIGKKFGDV